MLLLKYEIQIQRIVNLNQVDLIIIKLSIQWTMNIGITLHKESHVNVPVIFIIPALYHTQ